MRVLMAYEKHGDRVFDATTDVQLAFACVKLLRERFREGWYNPGQPPTDGRKNKLCSATIAELRRERVNYEEAKQFYEDVQAVLAEPVVQRTRMTGNPLRSNVWAWRLLEGRAGYEYERVELEELPLASYTLQPPGVSAEQHFWMEQEGWSIFDVNGRQQVQAIDERGLLPDDAAAWKLAREMGLAIDAEGWLIA